MKIKARTKDDKVVYIVKITADELCDFAITIDKFGTIDFHRFHNLTVIDEDYLPTEGEQ